jgi:amidase
LPELAYSSAIAIAKQIRERKISSKEALEYFLARVRALDQPINSVVTIDADRARAEADDADAMLARGEVRGPLHGVPMTIKDSFQTARMRTTSGAQELASFVPKEDAWPVAAARSGSYRVRQNEFAALCGRPPELQRNLWDD